MATESLQTENLIKETAKNIFFKKGLLSATTQEIADEAGVNRALIHYYFRNREQLVETVLDDALNETRAKIHAIFESEEPFKQKISRYLDIFIDRDVEYPYIQNFIITEITRNPEKMKEHSSKKKNYMQKLILPELKKEMEAGRVPTLDAEHFMVNLMSLCSYPLIAKPFIQNVFSFDIKDYKTFLRERKKVIYKVLFQEDFVE